MKKLLIAGIVLAFSASLHAKDGKDPFAPCRADMERLCKDVKPGDGRQVKCMMENKSKASGACQAVIAEKEAKEKQWQANKEKNQQVKHQKP